MLVLVVNAGSSSLKYQLMDTESETVWANGLVERIGDEGSALTHRTRIRGGAEAPMVETTARASLATPERTASLASVWKVSCFAMTFVFLPRGGDGMRATGGSGPPSS